MYKVLSKNKKIIFILNILFFLCLIVSLYCHGLGIFPYGIYGYFQQYYSIILITFFAIYWLRNNLLLSKPLVEYITKKTYTIKEHKLTKKSNLINSVFIVFTLYDVFALIYNLLMHHNKMPSFLSYAYFDFIRYIPTIDINSIMVNNSLQTSTIANMLFLFGICISLFLIYFKNITKIIYCQDCQTKNNADVKFCTNCGKKLSKIQQNHQ